MKISLMVSTYNWKEALGLCLESVFAQTRLPMKSSLPTTDLAKTRRNWSARMSKSRRFP